MAQVVVGAISDRLGFASSWQTVEARHAGRNFDVQRTFWACPSDKFRMVQPADLTLEAGHYGPRLGTVEHLELRRDKRLWIVAEVGDKWDLTQHDRQLSYDLVEKPDGYLLNAVAVVPKSATICLPPLTIKDGKLHEAARRVSSATTAPATSSRTPTRRRRHAEADRC